MFQILDNEQVGSVTMLTRLYRSTLAAETPGISWYFWVNHFQNETQARRDNKYTYRLTNGSYYIGLDPPKDAEP
jgi:choline dehydrogenase